MSWVRIWVHLVFSTKHRTPYLKTLEIRETMFNHIAENAKKKDIWMESVGGYSDHAHCLVSLKRNQNISQVAQLIKGESSSWINKNRLLEDHFNWQDDYWAVSVSESHLNSVINYIQNQEDHHRIKSFAKEVDIFMKKYRWQLIKD